MEDSKFNDSVLLKFGFENKQVYTKQSRHEKPSNISLIPESIEEMTAFLDLHVAVWLLTGLKSMSTEYALMEQHMK